MIKKRMLLAAVVLAVGNHDVVGYDWQTYEGHRYALTDHGTWSQAEAEAVAAGGHLAAINDEAENLWVSEIARNSYSRDFYGQGNQNAAWIGHIKVGEQWQWTNGDPVTFTNYAHNSPIAGIHAFVFGADYVSGVHPAGPYPRECMSAGVKMQ